MAGIDAIVEAIAQEAESSAKQVVADAEAEARGLVDDAKASAARYLEDEAAKLEDDGELARQRTKSRCDMIVSQRRLAGKQELVQSAIDRAKAELASLPDEEYFSTLLGLVGTHALAEDGQMLLSERDIVRMPSDFPWKVDGVAKGAGGSLDVEKADFSIEAGFVLRYGMIDVSCTLDALFAEHADELRDRAAELLFRE